MKYTERQKRGLINTSANYLASLRQLYTRPSSVTPSWGGAELAASPDGQVRGHVSRKHLPPSD